jgi:UrcA family protein
MSKQLTKLSAIALAMCLSAPAFAADPASGASVTVPVSYADLDVSTTDGLNALKARVERAAEAVCGPAPFILDLQSRTIYDSCIHETAKTALNASGLPGVAEIEGPQVALAQK